MNLMNKPNSPRAASAIVFACFSMFMWRIYGRVHWMLERGPRFRVGEPLFYADRELVVAYLTLALLSVLWTIWSWMTESRLAAIICSIFSISAVAVVSTMSTHMSP